MSLEQLLELTGRHAGGIDSVVSPVAKPRNDPSFMSDTIAIGRSMASG